MSNDSSNTLLAFLLGAVVGGVAAVLLTPTSGPEMRRRVGDAADRFREDARDLADAASRAASEAARDSRDRVRRVTEQASERFGKTVDEARRGAGAQRAALLRAYEEGKQAYERELGGEGEAGDDSPAKEKKASAGKKKASAKEDKEAGTDEPGG